MSFLKELQKKRDTFIKKEIEEQRILEEEDKLSEMGKTSSLFSPFDFFNALTINKIKWEDLGEKNQKAFNPYSFEKIVLSMIPDFVVFLTEVQKIKSQLSPEMYYKYLYYFIPKMSFKYKYVKKQEEEKVSKEVVDLFKLHFQEKKENVLVYLKMLKPKQIISLLKKYGWSDEKINKNLKVIT